MNSNQIQKRQQKRVEDYRRYQKTKRAEKFQQYQTEKKKAYFENLNEQLAKLEKLKSQLPELNNCDKIINHWSRELLTLYSTCRKSWNYGQHIEVKIDTASPVMKLYVSSTLDIIENVNGLPFDDKTVILISNAKSKEATLFFWRHRHDTWKYSYMQKINETSFKIWNIDKTEIRQYVEAKQVGLLKNIQRFQNQSLVALCLDKTRKIGTQKSNQNSAAQKARRGIKCLLEFHCPDAYNEEVKDMLDAYKIAAGKYNYSKSYRQFVRDIQKSGTLEFEMDRHHKLVVSLVSTPA